MRLELPLKVAKHIPMRRELKVQPPALVTLVLKGRKAHPDEKGTERSSSLMFVTAPTTVAKHIPMRRELKVPWNASRARTASVAKHIPMRRELKVHLRTDPSPSFQPLSQSTSR